MKPLRAILTSALALLATIAVIYIASSNIEFAIPSNEVSTNIKLVEEPCKNVELLEKEILVEMENAKACTLDEQCQTHYLGCPFGCSTTINSNEVARINSMIQSLPEHCPRCTYRCLAHSTVPKCISGYCEATLINELQPPDFEIPDYDA